MRILFIGTAPRNRTARATERIARATEAMVPMTPAEYQAHLAKCARIRARRIARDQKAYDKRAARTAAWEAKTGKKSA